MYPRIVEAPGFRITLLGPPLRADDVRNSLPKRPLHLDIAYELIPFLETPDLLTLMRTCKALREPGSKHILSRRIAVGNLRSFALFMSTSNNRLYQHLRHLNYSPRHGETFTVTVLLSILSQAIHLESLQVSFDLASIKIPNGHVRLSEAISHMNSLRGLHLRLTCTNGLSLDESALLRGLTTETLTNLRLSFQGHCDPFPFLSPTCLHDITSLHLQRAVFAPLALPLPHLKSLTIQETTMQTRALITSFPNLQNLRLLDTWAISLDQATLSEMRIMHAMNRSQQEQIPGWSYLDTLSGSLPILFRYGVAAPVRTLRVESDVVLGVHDDIFCGILLDTQTSCLSMTLSHFGRESTPARLEKLKNFTPILMKLDRLFLRVMWYSKESKEESIKAANDFVDALFNMLAQLPLTILRLKVVKKITNRDPEDHVNLDAYEAALRLVQQLPNLQHIGVQYQVSDMEPTHMRYWSVTTTGDEPGDYRTMQELEPTVGEEIIGEPSVAIMPDEW